MAYVVDSAQTKGASSGTITVSLPDHQVDDVLFVFFNKLNHTPTTPSGWTDLTGTLFAGAARNTLFYKVVTSAPVADPTITFTSGLATSIAVVVRGADTTTPIDDWDHDSSTSGARGSLTLPVMTATDSNALVLLFCGGERVNEYGYIKPGQGAALVAGSTSESSSEFGYTYHQGGGSTPSYKGGNGSNSANSGIMMLGVVVRDDGNGNCGGYVDPTSTVTYTYPFVGATSSVQDDVALSATNLDITSVSFTPQITTITNAETGVTTDVLYEAYGSATTPNTINTSMTGPGHQANTGAGQNNKILTSGIEFTSTQDFSNKLVCISAYSNSNGVNTLSNCGRIIGFGDNSNASTFLLEGADAKVNTINGLRTFVIDTASGLEIDTHGAGSINWSAIKHIYTGTNDIVAGGQLLGFGGFYILQIMEALGGSVNKPCNFSDLSRFSKSGCLNTIQDQGGLAAGQFFSLHELSIGNGVNAVTWNSNNQSVEFPAAYDYAAKLVYAQVPAGRLGLTINTTANCSITLTNTVVNCGNFHKFFVDSGASASASYNMSGLVVLNSEVTLADLGANKYNGATFSGCNEINYHSLATASALGGVTISNCVETYAITVTSKAQFEALQNVDFKNNNFSIKITGDQTGTWSGTGITVSGGVGSYDIEYTGTTDFEIAFDIGSGWSQVRVDNTTAVAAGNTGLTVVTPTVSLTVTSNIASSDIKIFNTGTQTIEAQTTGTTVSTETAGTYDITVQKAGYLPQRQTGIVLGTSSVPVSITLVADPVYNASHGLAYTTDFTYNRTTKKLTCVTRQAGRNFYSALIDAFIAQSSLDNTDFPFTAVGIDSIFFNDGAELLDATSEDNWYDAGIRYIDSGGTTTAEWCSIKSSGSIPAGVTGRYQTSAGGGTTALRTTGAVNQIIQIYGDASHNGPFDYRSYLVIKFQANPYVDTRSDILALAGVSTLEPFEYSVAISPTALDITAGTGGATLTLVDHTAAPITKGGKTFSYEIRDEGTASAEDILRTWDYSIAQTGTYQGTDTFNLPEFITQSGATYETRRGIVETEGDTFYGCYVSRGGNDHPGFTRFQSDDGTYYTPAVTANITITNLPDDVGGNSRLQIYNITTAAEYYNDDPAGAGYSASYIDGVGISAGDSIRIRYAHLNGATSFELGQTITTASSDGFTVDGSNFISADDVYAANAVDGSLITNFTADFVEDQIEIASDTDFTAAQAYAFYCYQLTTATGIGDFWGGVTANDTGNYRINHATVNILFDSPLGITYSVKQTDTARIYTTAGTGYPVKDPTSSGYGVQVNWQNVVYVQNIGGSALLPAESAALTAIKSKTDSLTFTTPNVVDASASVSAASIRSAIGMASANLDTQLATITADTNELQTNQGNWLTATGFATTNPDNASIAAIKAKTDQLAFTVAGQVDANTKSNNDAEVIGDGSEADPWRGVGVSP